MQVDILFAIMAVQEVVFFAPIAKRFMQEEGLVVAFLTFHEAGDDILQRENIPFFSLHKMKRALNNKELIPCKVKKVEDTLKIRVNDLGIHEGRTANRNEDFLNQKTGKYYTLLNNLFNDNRIRCVVQELGGFIAPQLLYHLSRYHNVNHVFIEPAMFPKRIVFTLNKLYADIYDYNDRIPDTCLDEDVASLVNKYVENKTVVIPKKDRHFFQDMGFKRLLSSDNFRRLSRKLYHKYVISREEEYDAIMSYSLYHFKKLYRRKGLSQYYSNPVAGDKYVYFPFHVPLDVQLTVRCPEFLDQETLVETIANSLPKGYKLYIKEHPAAIGAHSQSKLRRLIAHKNIRLLHSKNNSFDIIKNSRCVITINSKVGFEAIMQAKPVLVLGKTFYRGKGVTIDANDLSMIAELIKKAMNMRMNSAKRLHLLNRAFKWSYPGELYENSHQNVEGFYRSLKDFLIKSNAIGKDVLPRT